MGNITPVEQEQVTTNGAVVSAEGNESNETLIFVKSHGVGLDSKGRQKVDLRLSEEETATLISELAKIKKRAKLQIHIGESTAFMFIKEVQPKGEMMTKKKDLVSSATKAKLAAFKAKQ